jgi:hypothetical protein
MGNGEDHGLYFALSGIVLFSLHNPFAMLSNSTSSCISVAVKLVVGVRVMVRVGVRVGVKVWVGVFVEVEVGTCVGDGVIVGPRNCPGPQAEIARLIIRTSTIVIR